MTKTGLTAFHWGFSHICCRYGTKRGASLISCSGVWQCRGTIEGKSAPNHGAQNSMAADQLRRFFCCHAATDLKLVANFRLFRGMKRRDFDASKLAREDQGCSARRTKAKTRPKFDRYEPGLPIALDIAPPDRLCPQAERWPSGRRRPPAKRVYGQKPYRGFESHPLRHCNCLSYW
jgi:hypothetical protein